jgi:hypothetical protein
MLRNFMASPLIETQCKYGFCQQRYNLHTWAYSDSWCVDPGFSWHDLKNKARMQDRPRPLRPLIDWMLYNMLYSKMYWHTSAGLAYLVAQKHLLISTGGRPQKRE